MLHRIDDFLIDRVFQPIADALARWVSCYALAAFLLTGFGLISLVVHAIQQQWVALALWVSWVPTAVIRAHKLECDQRIGIIPADRIHFQVMRMGLMILEFSALPFVLIEFHPLIVINEADWCLALCAFFFMACRRNPPKPRRVRVGALVGVTS